MNIPARNPLECAPSSTLDTHVHFMPSSNPKQTEASAVVQLSHALRAFTCAAVLLHTVSAAAQEDRESTPYGLSGSIGIGVLSTTTYEGSDRRRTVLGPDVSLNYRTQEWGSVELGPRALIWQPLELDDFKLGIAAGFDPGRKTKDSSTADPTPGDKRLAGMGAVRSSPEAGLLLGFGPFSMLAHKAVGDRGHKGTQVDFTAAFPFALTDKVGMSFGVGASWADKRYTQAYFGVTPAQSHSSGFKTYSPEAGVRKFEASVGAEYAFAKNWKLQGSLVLSRLAGDAEHSPLVMRRSSASASTSLAYVF
ncbi:MAG: MipA/OmpV family protein [Hydrogenophaga sp.]|uniref:MipA/OmpV family protein n=1 Tax=Hydrogenophaga sp. TaxID=1904254 RepID=UPI002719CDB9|nr:MipA/OmpV family protein [Hydrogenophaga sp.]MDO9250452.1 MipA/OmpV family protein [Hydrogenophaga sp.]MDP2406009.1 MipA/OmpV family protein [Hydrogenophaga sp.]MDZ4176094.1 MipA/OmpV family protein [Hydrogenophaga sp.]